MVSEPKGSGNAFSLSHVGATPLPVQHQALPAQQQAVQSAHRYKQQLAE